MPSTLFLLMPIPTLAVGCTPGVVSEFQSGPNITIAADALVDDNLYLPAGRSSLKDQWATT
jgi:hypothetical protein